MKGVISLKEVLLKYLDKMDDNPFVCSFIVFVIGSTIGMSITGFFDFLCTVIRILGA